MATKIEWTDATWNPVRGCSRVSEGCRNCYAERIAARYSAPGLPFEGFARWYAGSDRAAHARGPEGVWTGRVELIPEKLNEPLRWRKPRRVFVNSMSDLFHEKLSFDDIRKVFAVMDVCAATNRGHVFQILTKRAARMREFMAYRAGKLRADYGPRPPFPDVLPNVWLGVSVEDQATADERIPLLLQTPAAVRFISAEPLLGPIDLVSLRGGTFDIRDAGDLSKTVHPPGLHWVIVGGESGPCARPMKIEWARSLIQQCRSASVPVFMKQVGTNPKGWEEFDGERVHRGIGRGKGGNPEEWDPDLRVRQFPEMPA